MASKTIAIHPAETSVLAGTKSAVICSRCRKHDDVQTHESIEKYQSTTEVPKDADHFDCSICLSGCHDPVVTLCGHLFCWPCLYYWLSLHSLSQKCPVCNAILSDKIIPLYGHGDAEPSVTSPAVMFPDLHVPSRPSPCEFAATVIATNTVTNSDGDLLNNAVQAYEIHSTRLTACSANVGFFASMLIRSCVASFTPHSHGFFCGRRASNRASVLQGRRQQQRRFSNEKELVLHWVFIFVASIAIACFIVY